MGNNNKRLLSLDVFRGITIVSMILVNNPGSWSNIYPPLKHAEWNGCTPTDLIFPFFLFIVGVAITLSLSKRKERGDNQYLLMKQISRRSVTLFLLGIILSTFPFFTWNDGFSFIDLANVRIPGVLQRIAVVYFISSFLFLKSSHKTLIYICGTILVLYWMILSYIPVPDYGLPNLNIKPTNEFTNIAAWLDHLILGNHVWRSTAIWDPEGILSTFPAVTTAILGILTGKWLKEDINEFEKAAKLFVAGNLILLAGYVFSAVLPINKSLWTSSYVLYTSGWAIIFLATCYWIIDVKGYKKWITFFHAYGMNAITVFFLSGIVGRLLYMIKLNTNNDKVTVKTFLFQNFYLSWLPPIDASLLYAITFILIFYVLVWILYVKKIFIKV